MKKTRILLVITTVASLLLQLSLNAQTIEKVAPGVWKVSYGIAEKFKPSDFKEAPALESLKELTDSEKPPFDLTQIKFRTTNRGCVAELTMDE